MGSKAPTKLSSRQTGAATSSPYTQRHSATALDGNQPANAHGNLRKEQSSPAVIQGGDGSLVKQVVSASGQGCAAVVPAGTSTGHDSVQARSSTIWRTRSVRSKAESYCILSLKGNSQRGVTVQVGG